MKKLGIGLLVVVVAMLVVLVFIWNGKKESIPYPPAAAPVVDIESKPLVSTPHGPTPVPPLSSPLNLKDTESDLDDVPVQAASIPATLDDNATEAKKERAWYEDEQVHRLLERDPEYLAQWRRGIQGWIGGRMGRASHIEISDDEVEQLTEVFQEATIEFCKMWHPIIQEGLAQPGQARDQVAMLHAARPSMMLMLYAIPVKEIEITNILGPERYLKLHESLNEDFLRWYDRLTDITEMENEDE